MAREISASARTHTTAYNLVNLTSKTLSLQLPAPSRLRDREASISAVFPRTFRAAFESNAPVVARAVPRRLSNLAVSRTYFEEFDMSARNGNRSRFHIKRKQNIARRKRTRELLTREATQPAQGAAKQKQVTA